MAFSETVLIHHIVNVPYSYWLIRHSPSILDFSMSGTHIGNP